MATNFRRRSCEIDIIALRHGVLSFVEVKYRRCFTSERATIDNLVCARKRRAMRKGADFFCVEFPVGYEVIRFDLAVVCLWVGDDKKKARGRLFYYPGVF